MQESATQNALQAECIADSMILVPGPFEMAHWSCARPEHPSGCRGCYRFHRWAKTILADCSLLRGR